LRKTIREGVSSLRVRVIKQVGGKFKDVDRSGGGYNFDK